MVWKQYWLAHKKQFNLKSSLVLYRRNRLGADPPTVLLNFQKIFRCRWHSSVLQALLSFRVFLVPGIYSSRSLHGPLTLLAWDYIAVWIKCDVSDWMTTDKLIKSTWALSLNFQVRSLRVGNHPTWSSLYHINLGPAALTLWYQGYYDTWLRGQYVWKIREMHAQYGECVPRSWNCWSRWVNLKGPIIRINPFEIHIMDPEYIDQVYAGSIKIRDKYKWANRYTSECARFCAAGTLWTGWFLTTLSNRSYVGRRDNTSRTPSHEEGITE